jgi:cell division transport system ATP-binding protein
MRLDKGKLADPTGALRYPPRRPVGPGPGIIDAAALP